MNEIKIFEFENMNVRTLQMNNEPYFVAKDVASVLGYSNARDAINRHVDKEDKGVVKLDTLGGKQNQTIINESGMYALIFSSKLDSAKRFKRWVTSKVLPDIRKNGMYMEEDMLDFMLNDPDKAIALLTEYKKSKERQKELEAKIEQDKPKVEFVNAVSDSNSTILIGDLAKLLKQNGVDIGQNRLYEYLRENNYLIKRKGQSYNFPTQKAMDLELFKVKETVVKNKKGTNFINTTTKVTGKGQRYFIKKLLGEIK